MISNSNTLIACKDIERAEIAALTAKYELKNTINRNCGTAIKPITDTTPPKPDSHDYNIKDKIFSLICENPGISTGAIKKKLGYTTRQTLKYIRLLLESGKIKKSRIGNVTTYNAVEV